MLNDITVKNAIPREKIFRIFDEKGLYIEISPKGGKYWRFKYRYLGKEKRVAFGVYPEVSLKEAREKRDKARKQLADGLDPAQERKLEKLQRNINSENNFENIAREWHTKQTERWTERHAFYVLILF
jgi:hypothetical protein